MFKKMKYAVTGIQMCTIQNNVHVAVTGFGIYMFMVMRLSIASMQNMMNIY